MKVIITRSVDNCCALLNTRPNADNDTVVDWLQSNFCRYTGYAEIKDAMRAVIPGQA